MKTNTSRIITETLVRKAIRDMKDSPERSSRNLVDMAMQFAKGRFQKHFFSSAQAMLQNEHSPYYRLITDIVTHTDTERLITLGMNIGYNSCTAGAAVIRGIEEKERYNIPWNLWLKLTPVQYKKHRDIYLDLISQGEALGIYTWMLFFEDYHYSYLSLAKEHPDSAFILFCTPAHITAAFLDDLDSINNIMVAVAYEENADSTYSLLREHGIPFSLYCIYQKDLLESILNGDILYSAQQYHPIFMALLPDPDCSAKTKDTVYEYVKTVRTEHVFQTIPWELMSDSMFIDHIISEDSCQAGFDSDGTFIALPLFTPKPDLNLFHSNLQDILQKIYPK